MRIIGITGPTGSGKTRLTEKISALGIPTVNADELYHSMLVPPSACLDAIRSQFGDEVFCGDGTLDRALLSKVVFSDKQKLELLNKTVLDIVISEMRRIISTLERNGNSTVAIDAPTLIESGFHKECDTVISVISAPELRAKRISERDSITPRKALERIKAQKDDAFYVDNSDVTIYNNNSTEEFEFKIDTLISELNLNNGKERKQ